MKLGSGIAPITKMLEMGINIGLGNDGNASNDNQDMFEEMRFASLLQKVQNKDPQKISSKDVFNMATAGGALATGTDAGILKEGKLADIVLIDLNKPHLLPMGEPLNMLAYCVRGSDVDMVIIDGKIVLDKGMVVSLPEKEIMAEALRYIELKLEEYGLR